MKLENLLLVRGHRERANGHEFEARDVLKLADFGFARRCRWSLVEVTRPRNESPARSGTGTNGHENSAVRLVNYSMAPFDPIRQVISCGSQGYMAPEILQRRPVIPFALDVFAAGICVYAMVKIATNSL